MACSGCGIKPTTPAVGRGDAGDTTLRAVGVLLRVTEDDAAFALEFVENLLGRLEATFTRLQGMRNLRAGLVSRGPRRVVGFDRQPLVAADEVQTLVTGQGTGQQSCFAEDLETVADAQTGMPPLAASTTLPIAGAKRAIAPQRR